MKPEEVGTWRFCPACGRPIKAAEFDSEDPNSEAFDFESPVCSCCDRAWIACPCTPAVDGDCKSIEK